MNATDPTLIQLERAMRTPAEWQGSELANLHELLTRPTGADRPWMLYGIIGSCAFFAAALLAALGNWPETVVYLLAAGCLGALAWGAWRGSVARQAQQRATLAALAEQPLAILVRATVSTDLPESARVLVVNFLNRTYPGWTVDLEAADPEWRALKNARGVPSSGGCGGCGSRCG